MTYAACVAVQMLLNSQSFHVQLCCVCDTYPGFVTYVAFVAQTSLCSSDWCAWLVFARRKYCHVTEAGRPRPTVTVHLSPLMTAPVPPSVRPDRFRRSRSRRIRRMLSEEIVVVPLLCTGVATVPVALPSWAPLITRTNSRPLTRSLQPQHMCESRPKAQAISRLV